VRMNPEEEDGGPEKDSEAKIDESSM